MVVLSRQHVRAKFRHLKLDAIRAEHLLSSARNRILHATQGWKVEEFTHVRPEPTPTDA